MIRAFATNGFTGATYSGLLATTFYVGRVFKPFVPKVLTVAAGGFISTKVSLAIQKYLGADSESLIGGTIAGLAAAVVPEETATVIVLALLVIGSLGSLFKMTEKI